MRTCGALIAQLLDEDKQSLSGRLSRSCCGFVLFASCGRHVIGLYLTADILPVHYLM